MSFLVRSLILAVHSPQANPLPCGIFQFLPFLGVPTRFYKVRDHLTLRCRDCHFDRREGRLYVECKTYPRHKQAQKMREPRQPWTYKRAVWKHYCY
ncbi:hypothetical protein CLF_111859 [Clonorchis sinensis]|uniref:Ribosomal protein n=1 Tax=Clonorchis sinensis TaxID=79923 RepID=G7YVF8_CLOSI|nr:hypothetical protein CLF_111859 [Clonorchis sinensis]